MISGQAFIKACLVTAGTEPAAGFAAGAAGADFADGMVSALGAAGAVFVAATLGEAATVVTTGSTAEATPMRRSSLSILARDPTSVLSLAGTRTFAHINSSCSLGLVAPDISESALATAPAAWVSSAIPKLMA